MSLFRISASRSVRSFSTFPACLVKQQTLQSLQFSIKQKLTPKRGQTIEEATFIKSIQDILKYREQSKKTELKSVDALFNEVVEASNFRVDEKLLKKLLLLKLPLENTLTLIQSFYNKNSDAAISKQTAMVPLRQLLWDGDVTGALKVIDLTTGSDRYISQKKHEQGMTLIKYFGGLAGMIGSLDFGLRAFGVEPMIGMYAMFVTYIVNMSFFATLAFSGKLAGKSEYVQFVPGVPQTYRLLHADELEMLSRAAEVDAIVNGVDSYASAEFVEKIVPKSIELVESESQILTQEYWLSGGDNFEWVEPDQDPAELLWKERSQVFKPKALKATKWTENLIESSKEDITDLKGSVV